MISELALWCLAISLVLGQLVRFPLPGQSGGMLVSDIVVVLTLVVAGIQYLRAAGGTAGRLSPNGIPRGPIRGMGEAELKVRAERVPAVTGPATYYAFFITPFIVWSLFTLAIRVGDYSQPQLAIAGAYWLRTSAYLLLAPALIYLTRSHSLYTTLHRSLVTAIVALASIGSLQLLLFPDLAALPPWLLTFSGGGWDPHAGRAVATWLDPNFFGAFVSMGLLYLLGRFFAARSQRHKIFFLGVAGWLSGLLIMTESRSSLVALALAILLLSPVVVLRLVHQRERALVPAAVAMASVAAVATLLAALTLGERFVGLLTFDPTVQFRIDSLAAIWRIASEHSLVGVGYNAWQFVAQREGLIGDFSLHSRAGADNSWVTLLITTGIPGVFFFALPWVVIVHQFLRRWLLFGHVLPLTSALGLLTLTVHSQFVNSWLYAHLLIVAAMIVALANTRYDAQRA